MINKSILIVLVTTALASSNYLLGAYYDQPGKIDYEASNLEEARQQKIKFIGENNHYKAVIGLSELKIKKLRNEIEALKEKALLNIGNKEYDRATQAAANLNQEILAIQKQIQLYSQEISNNEGYIKDIEADPKKQKNNHE